MLSIVLLSICRRRGLDLSHLAGRDCRQTLRSVPYNFREEKTVLKETPFAWISSLIDALADVLYPYMDFPFAFFGHSLGSLISFELTRWLRRQKTPSPIQLFVSGSRAPQIPNPHPPFINYPIQILSKS